MKIAVLSDIHGNDVAFEAVAQDIKEQSVNCVVFLGDLVAQGAQPQECYDRLKKMAPLVWLKGHTEYWLDDAMIDVMPTSPQSIILLDYYDYMVKHMSANAMDALIAMKHTKSLHLGHYEGFCCHGTPRDVCEVMDPIDNADGTGVKLNNINASFVLSGHSHQQYDAMYRGVRIINPGAVGVTDAHQANCAKYAILETDSSFMVSLREVTYDAQRYIRIAEDRGFPGKNHYMGMGMNDTRTA